MAVEIPVDLQPELVPLAWLIGDWEGRGAVVDADGQERPILQRASFTREGEEPYLLYTCRTWLTDSGQADSDPADNGQVAVAADRDAPGTLLGVETGIWQLARERGDHDTGPGLLPPTADYPFTSAEAVEELRTERGDFDIEVALAYPHGLMEHYAGRIAGPRIDLVSDGGVKTPTALDYSASTRTYGLVNGNLMWVWEMAAEGREAAAHVSAELVRTTPSLLA